jgi:hypothetical protein
MGHLRCALSGEVVVVVEAVGLNDLVADARVVGDRPVDDGLLSVGAPTLVKNVSDGLGAERATRMRVADGHVEGRRTVEVEEAEETGGRASEMSAMERDLPEERLGCWTDGEEAVLPSMLPRLALLGRERLEMALVLDLPMCVVRADVTGDLDGPIEQTDHGLRSDEGERLAHVGMGDRVVISIEADVGRLPRGDRSDEVGGSRVLRERKKASTLDDERVADETTIGIAGDLAPALHAVGPHVELGVEVVDGVK